MTQPSIEQLTETIERLVAEARAEQTDTDEEGENTD